MPANSTPADFTPLSRTRSRRRRALLALLALLAFAILIGAKLAYDRHESFQSDLKLQDDALARLVATYPRGTDADTIPWTTKDVYLGTSPRWERRVLKTATGEAIITTLYGPAPPFWKTLRRDYSVEVVCDDAGIIQDVQTHTTMSTDPTPDQ